MFRAMRRSELETIAAIDAQSYEFPWTAGNFLDSMLAGYRCCVYEEQGLIVAYAVMMAVVDEAHLLNLTVVPVMQGNGYGRAMLHRLIDCARDSGFVSMWLEVRPSNRVARQLYLAEGFQQVGLRKGYYPAAHGREDALLMVLEWQGVE